MHKSICGGACSSLRRSKTQKQQHNQQQQFSTSRWVNGGNNNNIAGGGNLYNVLELPTTATSREIKRRFYELSKLYHPDRNRHQPEVQRQTSHQKFIAVNEAYSVLGDYQKRAAYDSHHHHHQNHNPHPFRQGSPTTTTTSGSDYYRARANRYNRTRGKYYGPPPGYNNTRPNPDPGPTSSGTKSSSYYETVNPRSPFRHDSINHFDLHRHFLVHQNLERRHQQTAHRRQMRSDSQQHSSDAGWRMATMCLIFTVIAAFSWGAKSHR